MIIKDLDLDVFKKVFGDTSDINDLVFGLAFDKITSTATVLLNYTDYEWRVIREVNEVRIYYSKKNGKPVCLGSLDPCDFEEITIC